MFLYRPQEQRKWKSEIKVCTSDITPSFYEFDKSSRLIRPFRTWKFLKETENRREQYEAIGFKVMYNHLYRQPEILAWLYCRRYKILHLVRENHIDVYLSRIRARKTGVAHSLRESKAMVTVEIDIQHLLPWLRRQERLRLLAATLLLPVWGRTRAVSYECLAKDPESVANDSIEFLLGRCESEHISSQLKKVSKGSHRDCIENFDEVDAALKGTKFYPMLRQD